MKREWKPGDVAVATVHGKPNIRVMATSGVEWVTHQGFAVSDRDGDTTGNVDNLRPLVVIDPEDREAVERLLSGYAGWKQRGESPADYPHYVDDMQAALREFADATPPKPEDVVADLIHEYAVTRGDLSEQYARDQLRDKIMAALSAGVES